MTESLTWNARVADGIWELLLSDGSFNDIYLISGGIT